MSLDGKLNRMKRSEKQSIELLGEALTQGREERSHTRGRKSEFYKEHVEPHITAFIQGISDPENDALRPVRERMNTEVDRIYGNMGAEDRQKYPTREALAEDIKAHFDRGLTLFLTIDIRRRTATEVMDPKTMNPLAIEQYLFDATRTYTLQFRRLLRSTLDRNIPVQDALFISQYVYSLPASIFEDIETKHADLELRDPQVALAIRNNPADIVRRLHIVGPQLQEVFAREDDSPNGLFSPSMLFIKAISHPNTFGTAMEHVVPMVEEMEQTLKDSSPSKYFPGDVLAEAVLDAFEKSHSATSGRLQENAQSGFEATVVTYAKQADQFLTRTDIPFNAFPREVGTIVGRRPDKDIPGIFAEIEHDYSVSLSSIVNPSDTDRISALRKALRKHTAIKRGVAGHDELVLTQRILEDLVRDDYKNKPEVFEQIFTGSRDEEGLLMQALATLGTESTGRLSKIAEACVFEPGSIDVVKEYLQTMYPKGRTQWLDNLDETTKEDLVAIMNRIRDVMQS